MSPRFEPVSVTQLSRVPLLAAIPGADLVRLASRLERWEAPPGTAIRRPGEDGARFVIVLSGLASTSTPEGGKGLLRPGDVFDATERPQATVGAMTPCVIASCDAATYEEMIRPHLGRA
jgi:CRP-like cAMP-binding protein